MKKLIYILVLSVFVSTVLNLGYADKKKKIPKGMEEITMEDLELKDMDPNNEKYSEDLYPFNDNPVYYKVVKMDKYDKFFKDAAIIEGTVAVAHKIVDSFEANPTEFIRKYLESGSQIEVFIKEALPASTEKAKSLLPTGQSLLKTAKSDFKGIKARKLPSVTSGLNGAIANLKGAIEDLPPLIEKIMAQMPSH